jgi:hypothetical protein
MTNMKIKGGRRTYKRRAMKSNRRVMKSNRRAMKSNRRTMKSNRRTMKSNRRKRRKGGTGHAGVLATAALPFGLFGLQKLFQKGRTRRQVRKVQKALNKDLSKLDVRRLLK